MAWLIGLKHALHRPSEEERRRTERRPATGLTALYGLDSASTPARIKDISTCGIDLYTDERPPVGQLINLILRKKGEPENNSELQISVQAEAVWHGEDSIGLSFVLPPGMDVDLWGVLIKQIVTLTDPDQVAEMFRSLRTFLFLCRLCPTDAGEAILLFNGQLDVDHTAAVFKIALTAEKLLEAEPEAARLRAHGKLVASILREGSWARDELTSNLWTGLLLSSCSVDAPDDSNQVLVDLLVHLTTVEARIFAAACARALGAAPALENSTAPSVVFTPEEIVRITGVNDLYRDATDLGYLYNLGLIEKSFDFSSYSHTDSFDVTPTPLCLALYQHCHGQREKLKPDLIESAHAHLADFLPAPRPVNDNQPRASTPPSSKS
jgi:PilZ domain-containing protein